MIQVDKIIDYIIQLQRIRQQNTHLTQNQLKIFTLLPILAQRNDDCAAYNENSIGQYQFEPCFEQLWNRDTSNIL